MIENKLAAGEHGAQLKRYQEVAAQHFAGWQVVLVYLSPLGASASEPEYRSAEYSTIVELLETLVGSPEVQPEVALLLRHYSELLRRVVLREDEVEALCQRLYQRHRQAFELIFERRNDPRAQVRDALERLVLETPGFQLDYAKPASRSYVGFSPVAWDAILPRGSNRSWSAEGRILLFWFSNHDKRLRISLQVSPDTTQEDRQRLLTLAEQQGAPFQVSQNPRQGTWGILYSRELLSPRTYQAGDIGTLLEALQASWESFLSGDFLRIDQAIQSLKESTAL